MKITTVYHWSPSTNREEILKSGIKIMMSEIHYYNEVSQKEECWKPPYICASTEAQTALTYVLPMFNEDVPELDLFQIILNDADRIEFRNDGTNKIIEVRIKNTIPADRVLYIATRK